MSDKSLAPLDRDDLTIASGDHDQGSLLLGEATELAMSTLAEHCGHPNRNEEDLMRFAAFLICAGIGFQPLPPADQGQGIDQHLHPPAGPFH